MLTFDTAALKVMVSLPVPPMTVFTPAMVAVLVAFASVRVSAPVPRLTLPFTRAVLRVTVSAPVPPISVSMLLTVPVLVKAPSVELALATTEIDAHRIGQRAAKRHGIGAGAAGNRLGVGHCDGVAEVAQHQLAAPPARSSFEFVVAAPEA